jgi:hypothetical protein
MNQRRLRTLAAVTVIIVVGTPGEIRAQSLSERRLEAAVISKFPQFVEWPPASLNNRSTIDLCVAAPDPFGADLDDLVSNEGVNGRALAVRRVGRDDDLAACQLLFVPAEAGTTRPAILQRAAALPILTISDAPQFLDAGGVIRLRLVDGRMRFDVNVAAAQRVGLRISSQLLRLALTVRGPA